MTATHQDPLAQAGLDRRVADLRRRVRELQGGVVVAFSGGVDSTVLLKVCRDELGDAVLAVTADSPSYPEQDRRDAEAMARRIGAEHLFVQTSEVEDERYRRNDAQRCYVCKRTLFETLAPIAASHGLKHLLFGANQDDEGDYRPGHRAAAEFKVRAPLHEAGLFKADIRRLAQALDLPIWNKPQSACLSSRIPYNTPIDPDVLRRIDAAETFLRHQGYATCRVRHHGAIARIELLPADLLRATTTDREAILSHLKQLGWLYVSLDLQGYTQGSLNAAIQASRESNDTGRPG